MSLDRRDEHLRAGILDAARSLGSRTDDGFVSGQKLAIHARDDHQHAADSEEHAARLIEDLIAWGLLVERPREDGEGNGVVELRHRFFKRTVKASRLWNREIAPIPGVYDRRAD